MYRLGAAPKAERMVERPLASYGIGTTVECRATRVYSREDTRNEKAAPSRFCRYLTLEMESIDNKRVVGESAADTLCTADKYQLCINDGTKSHTRPDSNGYPRSSSF